MRLINIDHSPYAARVKIQILQKALPVEIIEPPFPLKSTEFLATFPLGKLPLLELNDGSYLPESIAIMQYLEEVFPEPSCQPDNPLDRARMKVMISFTDTHLGPALLPFFKAMLLPDFEFDPKAQCDLVVQTMERFDRWLAANDTAERPLHLGDMVLIPTVWYTKEILVKLYDVNPFEGLECFNAWLERVNGNVHVASTIAAIDKAFGAFMQSK